VLDVAIATRHAEVPSAIKETLNGKLDHLCRYLGAMERAEVCFSEEHNPRIHDREVCEVTMHGHGHIVRARASAPDMITAVDRVLDKLEHRLERLKGRLVGRSHPRRHASVDSDTGQIADLADEAVDGDEPIIVKTKSFEIKPMIPEEAALQMELVSHDFFLFTNADTGRAGVVYRRRDGRIGLIDAS
jgi:putative sigma-54 modulation protein